MTNYVLGAVVAFLTFVFFRLKKLASLENKQMLDEVYKNAEKDVGNKSVDELVADDIRRRSERDSASKP